MYIFPSVYVKSNLSFELAPYLCPFSLISWFQKHNDQLWTHLGSVYPGMAIYDPEYAQNTKDMANFSKPICFDHNFLPNAVIYLIFQLVIYNFPNLSIDISFDLFSSIIMAVYDVAIVAIMAILL